MGRGSRRIPIQKPLIPTADLGMLERQIEGLSYPDDVPLVMALQVVQTPGGPRIVQAGPGATPQSPVSTSQLIATVIANTGTPVTAMAAYGYRNAIFVINVTTITGAPTNLNFAFEFSVDQGVTWFRGQGAQSSSTGVYVLGIGISASSPGVANDIRAAAAYTIPVPQFLRIASFFTAGAAPTWSGTISMIAS